MAPNSSGILERLWCYETKHYVYQKLSDRAKQKKQVNWSSRMRLLLALKRSWIGKLLIVERHLFENTSDNRGRSTKHPMRHVLPQPNKNILKLVIEFQLHGLNSFIDGMPRGYILFIYSIHIYSQSGCLSDLKWTYRPIFGVKDM